MKRGGGEGEEMAETGDVVEKKWEKIECELKEKVEECEREKESDGPT